MGGGGWALIRGGANSRMGAYSNKYGIKIDLFHDSSRLCSRLRIDGYIKAMSHGFLVGIEVIKFAN